MPFVFHQGAAEEQFTGGQLDLFTLSPHRKMSGSVPHSHLSKIEHYNIQGDCSVQSFLITHTIVTFVHGFIHITIVLLGYREM